MSLELRLPQAGLVEALASFFAKLQAEGSTRFFSPHPMTFEEAKRRVEYRGQDYYLLAMHEAQVVGYGFLRWWPEFPRPSLGIAVLPAYEGRGIARALLETMHAEARLRGCTEVRLRVHPENRRAEGLYARLGYVWQGERDRGETVGIKTL